MILKKSGMRKSVTDSCHGGKGKLECTELLAEYDRKDGFKYLHDDILEPGASIGEHEHKGDEEAYIILEGSGKMIVDGVPMPIKAGDICLTKTGHSHGLINGPKSPMRFIVACTNVTGKE